MRGYPKTYRHSEQCIESRRNPSALLQGDAIEMTESVKRSRQSNSGQAITEYVMLLAGMVLTFLILANTGKVSVFESISKALTQQLLILTTILRLPI